MVERRATSGALVPWTSSLRGDDWPLFAALGGVAILFVLSGPRIGWWSALVVALLVSTAGYLAYVRHLAAGRVSEQLVVTLGGLPQAASVVPPGHVDRSAILATAVGRRLGLHRREIAMVAAAARTRAVGRIGLDRWADGRDRFDERAVLRWSTDILRRGPGLDPVARLVDPTAADDADVRRRLMRAIVQITTAYDEATASLGLAADDAVALIEASVDEESLPVVHVLASIFGVRRGDLEGAPRTSR